MGEDIIIVAGTFLAVLYAILGNIRPRFALLTFYIPTGVLLYNAIINDDIYSLIFALLIVLATVLSVLLVKPKPGSSPLPWAVAKYLLFLLLAIPFLVLAPFIGPYGFFILMVVAGLIIRYSFISRDTIATHVFSTIGASMRQNLPLPTSLKAEAQGVKGKRRRIFDRISDWLAQGQPLSESIKRGYPKCPGYALAMIGAAEKVQQVPQAVASIEAQLEQKSRERQKIQPIHPAYPLAVVLVMFFCISGVLIFVVPKFEAIFQGMGQQLPLATRWIIAMARSGSGWIILLLGLVVLTVVPSAIYLRFRPRRPGQPYWLSLKGDLLRWHFPVLHWFARNYSLLQTVSFLRLSINAGSTVDEAIAGATELDTNDCYRRRLTRWLDEVKRGQDVSEAARKTGVGSALAWAFDQEINQGNTPAILESLESFYRTNYGYIVNLARVIFWPCVVILIGAVVGFVVYALFSPLIAMIHATVDATIQ